MSNGAIKNNNNIGGGKYERAIGLDLLRISLAILIFLFHSRIHVLKCDYGFLNSFIDMGAIAMTGFFMLSGYVLNVSYGSKVMTNGSEIKRFYLKRLISIIPLYYVWALVNVLQNIIVKGSMASIHELILFPIEALGIQSVYSSLFSFSHNGGSWFISCLLICYFLFPLFQTLTRSISDKCRIYIIILLSSILLYSPFVQHYFELSSLYSNPFFRSFEFLIGIIVSQLNVSWKDNSLYRILRNPVICIVTIILMIVGVSIARFIGIPKDYMLYNWIALPCFISLLFSLGYYKFGTLQDSKILHYLSELSFSLFLAQIIAVWYIVKYFFDSISYNSNYANIFLSAIICFCIANLFHFCIEKPSTKYLKTKLLNK